MSTLDDITATTSEDKIRQICSTEKNHLETQISNIDELESKIEKLEKLKNIVESPNKGKKTALIVDLIGMLKPKVAIKPSENALSKGGKRKARKTNRKSLGKRKNTLTKRRYRK